MTELDFEELDKAVSDLMKDTDEPTSTPAQAADAQIPATSVQNGAAQPQADASAQPVTPVVRNRGRFMDMKPSTNPTPVVKPLEQVSHQAPAINEPQHEQLPPETVDTVLDPQPVEQPAETPVDAATNIGDYAADPANVREHSATAQSATPNEETPKDEDAHGSFTMPDPIDMAAAEGKQPVEELIPEAIPVADEPSLATATDEHTDEPKPDMEVQPEPAMDSPFIPDAKVEKRPLGGFPEESTVVATGASDEKSEEAASAPLPRELGSDLMNLETDGNDVSGDKKDEPKAEVSAEPARQPEVPKRDEEKPVPVTPVAVPVNDPKATGGIFDTANYHNMSVAVPVKKKHGWMIIIWILILLIVGACAGAAYFYFTTQ